MLFSQKESDDENDEDIINSKPPTQPLIFIAQNDGIPKIYEFDIESLDFKMIKKLPSTFAANTSLVMIKDYLFVSNISGCVYKYYL